MCIDDLCEYLDKYRYNQAFEVFWAVKRFFQEEIHKDEQRTPSKAELWYFYELTLDYIFKRKLTFSPYFY